ncbi:hypothetical protein [Phosphitispora fastidiosa]|nr:hypothetical protein [Phosphitispora fastidiosa]MBU7006676.1 hypothetical protein [Phosphitispora fastidiosa]
MNKLCRLCLRECKQEKSVIIVECKRYCPAPVQVEFKFKSQKRKAGK